MNHNGEKTAPCDPQSEGLKKLPRGLFNFMQALLVLEFCILIGGINIPRKLL